MTSDILSTKMKETGTISSFRNYLFNFACNEGIAIANDYLVMF